MAFTFSPYQKKEYQQSERVTQAQDALQQHQQNKPGQYQSQWQQTMDDLLSQYQNRAPFQYDINADAMYQQMVDRYVQQGQQAMMDTVGQAAALTGGYGNSYAQIAGQQTYQDYLKGANDMMPQFYQMALDRYNAQGDQLLQQYGMVSDRENTDYGRYVDQVNQYYSELDRLQGAYESERDYDYGRFENDQSFDYGMHMDSQNFQYQTERDAVADDQWNQQWQYQQERDQIDDKRYAEKVAQAQIDYLISIGADIPDSLIAASGYDPAYVASIKATQAANAARAAASGGGGGGSSSGGGSKMTGLQAALLAAEAKDQGATSSQIKAALKSAGLSTDEAVKAIQNSSKITLHPDGKFASRAPR